jgi:hypothetical protein
LVVFVFFAVFGTIFFLFGSRRNKTVINKLSNTVEVRKGFVSAPSKGSWPLSAFSGVGLDADSYATNKYGTKWYYSVCLMRPNGDSVCLKSNLDEGEARQFAQRVAEGLGLATELDGEEGR